MVGCQAKSLTAINQNYTLLQTLLINWKDFWEIPLVWRLSQTWEIIWELPFWLLVKIKNNFFRVWLIKCCYRYGNLTCCHKLVSTPFVNQSWPLFQSTICQPQWSLQNVLIKLTNSWFISGGEIFNRLRKCTSMIGETSVCLWLRED